MIPVSTLETWRKGSHIVYPRIKVKFIYFAVVKIFSVKKEGLENLKFTGHIESKKKRKIECNLFEKFLLMDGRTFTTKCKRWQKRENTLNRNKI